VRQKKTWKRIKGYKLIPHVIKGVRFIDGEMEDKRDRGGIKMKKRDTLEKSPYTKFDNCSQRIHNSSGEVSFLLLTIMRI